MAEITVQLIKTLRDKTNAGMMDCKAALQEVDGDLEAAETVLRKKGIAAADKKSSRATKEGVIASRIDADAKTGVLIEVNCETDFVAKNEGFLEFVDGLLRHALESEPAGSLDELLAQAHAADSEHTVDEVIKAQIGSMGENMALRRFARYTVEGEGVIATYIHLQGKVGVLIEVNCGKAETAGNADFREVVKDLTLHIAAAQPVCISRDEVPAEKVETEREIFKDQVKDKPEQIVDRIVEGKLDKFYGTVCLLEQGFIKDPDQTIGDLLKAKAGELGDEISVRRFTRYAIGEEA